MLEQGCMQEAVDHAKAAMRCVRSSYGASSQVTAHEERKWLGLGLHAV